MSADTLATLSNYGVLGVMFVFIVGALLSGKLVVGWVYKRAERHLEELRAEKDREIARVWDEVERERAEKTALRTRMDEQVVPLLADTTHLLRDALRTIGDERGRG